MVSVAESFVSSTFFNLHSDERGGTGDEATFDVTDIFIPSRSRFSLGQFD